MRQFSSLVEGLPVSSVLHRRAEVTALRQAGVAVHDLTIGDLDPHGFPLPPELRAGLIAALRSGHTSYPPPEGLPELREVLAASRPAGGRGDPSNGIAIAAGARPLITATLRALIQPGEVVVFGVPSWNNPAFVHLAGGVSRVIPGSRATGFFPARERLRPLLAGARVLLLNSPLNPTSTVMDRSVLAGICQDLLVENRRRQRLRRRPLFLLFDGVYGSLVLAGGSHFTPLQVCPAAAPFVVEIDAASKALGAATGLRLGWAQLPPALARQVIALLGHEGAWAPTFVQKAAAAFLRDRAAVARNRTRMVARLGRRFQALVAGLTGLRRRGYPVDFVSPQGGLFLAVRLRRPGLSDEGMRRLLLHQAGLAVVPLADFGYRAEPGWFRMAVATSRPSELAAAAPRIQRLLDRGPARVRRA